MHSGTLPVADFNRSLRDLCRSLQQHHTADIWKLESDDTELVCYRDAETHNDETESGQLAHLEYRVTFSDAFGVPVLLFRGSFQDGSPVPLTYFWQCYISHSEHGMQGDDLWSTISQTEHKAFGVPYFFLHPCKTTELMRTVNVPDALSYVTLIYTYHPLLPFVNGHNSFFGGEFLRADSVERTSNRNNALFFMDYTKSAQFAIFEGPSSVFGPCRNV